MLPQNYCYITGANCGKYIPPIDNFLFIFTTSY